MAFDPDAYLAKSNAPAFNPDAYLSGTQQEQFDPDAYLARTNLPVATASPTAAPPFSAEQRRQPAPVKPTNPNELRQYMARQEAQKFYNPQQAYIPQDKTRFSRLVFAYGNQDKARAADEMWDSLVSEYPEYAKDIEGLFGKGYDPQTIPNILATRRRIETEKRYKELAKRQSQFGEQDRALAEESRLQQEADEAELLGDITTANTRRKQAYELRRQVRATQTSATNVQTATAQAATAEMPYQLGKGVLSGLTLGVSDIPLTALERATTGESFEPLSAGGQTLKSIGQLAGGVKSGLSISNSLGQSLSNINNPLARTAINRIGTATIQGGVGAASRIINGEQDPTEAAKDVGSVVVSTLTSMAPEILIPGGSRGGKIMNAVGQIVTAAANDAALGLARGQLTEDNWKQWLVSELPNLATASAFALRDATDVNFEATRQQYINALRGGTKDNAPVAPEQSISVQPKQEPIVGATAPKPVESGPTNLEQPREIQNAPIQEVQAKGQVELPIGPGAASVKDPTMVEGTALKNAVADIERIQTGIEPATPTEKMDFASKLTEGRTVIEKDATAGERLVADVLTGAPRPVTRTESGVLLAHKVKVANEMNAAAEAMQTAKTPQEQADASRRFDKAQQDFQNVLDASKSVGSEAGWTLAFRKLMVREDFSLPTMISKARTNVGGKELPKERQSKIVQQAKQIEDIQSKIDAIEQKKQSAGVDDLIAKTKAGLSPLTSESDAVSALKRIADKASDPKADISTDIQKLARYFVEQGVTERTALVKAVHAEVSKVMPEFTERMTQDAISGYGKYSPISKDDVSVTLRDLKGQLQQISKLEDMESGKAPSKTGVERRVPSDEERRLIKQVNEAKKAGGFEVTDPETQLRSALQAVKTRLQNQIKDLESQIASRQKIVRQKSPSPQDAESLALQKRRDALKAQFEEIFGRPELTDAQRLKAWKTRTNSRIAELEQRIAKQDFSKKPRRDMAYDREAQELQYRLEQVKRQYQEDMMKDWLANRTTSQKLFGRIGETINTARAIMTGGEFSAVLRQGGWFAFSHPIRTAKSIVPMFKAFRSEQNQFRIEQEIRNRENAPLYKKSGLYLSESNGPLSKMEEATMNRWAQKIPFIAGSQRAYNTFLNKLRADSFDAMVKGLSKSANPTTEELKAIANYINVATGRGTFGVHNENVAVGLNTFLFAPRYVASRFQLLAGQPIAKSSGRVRKAIAIEYARYLAGLGVAYSLAQLMGAEVEEDPRSSDFGKIKIGNTRIDPLSGLSQTTVFLSRLATGEKKRISGEVVPIRESYRPINAFREDADPVKSEKPQYGDPDVISNFLRQKLSPAVGISWNLLKGEDLLGDKYTAQNLLPVIKGEDGYRFNPNTPLLPITYGDIYSAMLEQGVPRGAAISLLAIFGAGVQSYSQDPKKQKKPSMDIGLGNLGLSGIKPTKLDLGL